MVGQEGCRHPCRPGVVVRRQGVTRGLSVVAKSYHNLLYNKSSVLVE